jgi:hypothetical protein
VLVAIPDLEAGSSGRVHGGALYRPPDVNCESGVATGPRVCLYVLLLGQMLPDSQRLKYSMCVNKSLA